MGGSKLGFIAEKYGVTKSATKKGGIKKTRGSVGRPKSGKPESAYFKMGRNFASLRRKRGMTQELISEKMGMGLKYWQALEAGDKAPSFAMLCNIRKGLNCDWNELLAGC